MRVFSRLILDLAEEFRRSPAEIKAFEIAYDFVGRFAFVQSAKELDSAVMEIKVGKDKFRYEEIPSEVKRVCILALERNGSIGRLYNDFSKPKNLGKFVKNMIEHKKQPKDFWSEGIITFRSLKHKDAIDNTIDTGVGYAVQERKSA